MKDNKLETKMKILEELNTDDSRYLFKICNAYINYTNEMNMLKKAINIELNNTETNIEKKIY